MNISNCRIEKALKNCDEATGTFTGQDLRGTTSSTAISDETKQMIKQHIEKFPIVASHYCRSKTKRLYLSSELTEANMYTLYKAHCSELEPPVTPVSESTYRKVFNGEYNLGFHRPKKDQCTACTKYKNSTAEKKVELEAEHQAHLQQKTECQQVKKELKAAAVANPEISVATFDLQSVQSLPSTHASPIFYKRKLNVYNMCFYNLGTADGYCYFWTECNGKRGSCEVGTCMSKYLESLPQTTKHVYLFSDCCGGQNRNQFTAAAILAAAQQFSFETITLCFLESGHTQMEVDSMHSAIENTKKRLDLYTVDAFKVMLQTARQQPRNPYSVSELQFSSFLDFKTLASVHFPPKLVGPDKSAIKWLKLKALRVVKGNIDQIFCSERIVTETNLFTAIELGRQKGRGRPTTINPTPKLYDSILPISAAKKKDLLDLCTAGVIKPEYASIYKELPCNQRVKDVEEVEDDDDEDDMDDVE